mmetsp:Transcript_35615/g.114641  ORF Transcript_35615/g.114641 Transcript_35615/m.114641 type:complete len:295 (-) Transcript_35615:733-1617(-)
MPMPCRPFGHTPSFQPQIPRSKPIGPRFPLPCSASRSAPPSPPRLCSAVLVVVQVGLARLALDEAGPVRLARRAVDPPVDVVRRLGGSVLLDERLHRLPRFVKLRQVVGEHRKLPVIVQKGVALAQFVVLRGDAQEEVADGSVVGEHQARDAVRRLEVRRSTREGHLHAGWSPRDEAAELSFPDALQRLVDLRRVHVALDDVEDRDVAAAVLASRARNHDVFSLQQPSHHVHDGRLPDSHAARFLAQVLERERSVPCHKEVEPWRRDERRDQADEVVVHVAREAQRVGRRGHHC